MQLVGFQKVIFKDKDTGAEVKGYSLYFVQPIPESRGTGYMFDVAKGKSSSLFITEDSLKKKGLTLKCGAEYSYSFTRYGTIDRDTLVKIS